MKILITQIDCEALEAKRNYKTEIARFNEPAPAALCALALAADANARHKDYGYRIEVVGKNRHDDLGHIFAKHGKSNTPEQFVATVKEAWKKFLAEKAKWKRIWKFVGQYVPKSPFEEYTRVDRLIWGDETVRAALWDERYEDAVAHFERLGIKKLSDDIAKATSETFVEIPA